MTFKIRLQRLWANPLHPVWIILAILELGVIIALFNRFVSHMPAIRSLFLWARLSSLDYFFEDVNRVLWGSYIVAGGIRVSEAIAAFSGNSLSGTWRSTHTMVIISMAVSYIFGPSLLLWGLKTRKEWIAGMPVQRSTFSILVAIAAGGYIVAGALLLPLGASLGSWNNWQKMKADNHDNALRDGAIASVSVLGNRAQQVRWMDNAKGGGPWKEDRGGITIAELEKVLPSLERGIWPPGARGSMKYLLEVASPDSLTIWGIVNVQGANTAGPFRNKDGASGNAQVRAGVTPAKVMVVMEN